MSPPVLRRFERVNKELWLLFSLFAIAGLLNILADSRRVILGFYTLPTVAAAYLYGRRHAVLTAYGSVLLALLVTALPTARTGDWLFQQPQQLADLLAWAGTLLLTAYLMGTVCERKTAQVAELRQTYNGVLMLLRHFTSTDDYSEHHAYRVSEYATRIGARLHLTETQLADVRAAALLHDIGKLDISRDMLANAAQFTLEDGGSLRRVIGIILAGRDHTDGYGPRANGHADLPVEARIIAVVDAYDSMTSDRPYRMAMSPFDARSIIEKGAGTDFDPVVVDAFLSAFRHGELGARLPYAAMA